MKQFLILATTLLFIGCEKDGADFKLDISPSEVTAGDTAYFEGRIEATSSITQDDIKVTFTDANKNYISYFTMLKKDTLNSDDVIIGKNNYKLAFEVSKNTPVGDYRAHLAVTVGAETPKTSASFSVIPNDTDFIKINLNKPSASDTFGGDDTFEFQGTIETSQKISDKNIAITFKDSTNAWATNSFKAIIPSTSIDSTWFQVGKEYYNLAFSVDSSAETGAYSGELQISVGDTTEKMGFNFYVKN